MILYDIILYNICISIQMFRQDVPGLSELNLCTWASVLPAWPPVLPSWASVLLSLASVMLFLTPRTAPSASKSARSASPERPGPSILLDITTLFQLFQKLPIVLSKRSWTAFWQLLGHSWTPFGPNLGPLGPNLRSLGYLWGSS